MLTKHDRISGSTLSKKSPKQTSQLPCCCVFIHDDVASQNVVLAPYQPLGLFGVDPWAWKVSKKDFKLCVLNVDYSKQTNVSIYISFLTHIPRAGILNWHNRFSPVALSITVIFPFWVKFLRAMTLVRKKINVNRVRGSSSTAWITAERIFHDGCGKCRNCVIKHSYNFGNLF